MYGGGGSSGIVLLPAASGMNPPSVCSISAPFCSFCVSFSISLQPTLLIFLPLSA